MLRRLLTYYQVMPTFLDFLFVYGAKYSQDRAIRFSSFRTNVEINGSPASGIDGLGPGRSGLRYQVCYNLKAVGDLQKEDHTEVWILKYRQAAVHHQFDLVNGTQLWIVGDPHSSLTKQTSALYPANTNTSRFMSYSESFQSSLRIHLNYMYATLRTWGALIQKVEENIQTKVCNHLLPVDAISW